MTDASDGEGHEPDSGSPEWRSAIERRTEDCQREAQYWGIEARAAALIVFGTTVMLMKPEKEF